MTNYHRRALRWARDVLRRMVELMKATVGHRDSRGQSFVTSRKCVAAGRLEEGGVELSGGRMLGRIVAWGRVDGHGEGVGEVRWRKWEGDGIDGCFSFVGAVNCCKGREG